MRSIYYYLKDSLNPPHFIVVRETLFYTVVNTVVLITRSVLNNAWTQVVLVAITRRGCLQYWLKACPSRALSVWANVTVLGF